MADDGAQSVSPEDAAFHAVFPHGLPASRPIALAAIVRSFPLEVTHLTKLAEHAESGNVLGVENQRLARIKHRHHRLAMMLAGGMRPDQAAMACGYHPSTISILCNDPMFAELLDLYSEGVQAEFRETIESMRNMTDELVAELEHRLETSPEQFTIGQLNELLKTFADRSGSGPSSTSNINAQVVAVDGATLERIKAAARTARPVDRQVQRLAPESQRAIEGVFTVNVGDPLPPYGFENVGDDEGFSLRAEDAGQVEDTVRRDNTPDDGAGA